MAGKGDSTPNRPSLFEPHKVPKSDERCITINSSKDLAKSLYNYQQEGTLCDVTIIVGKTQFRAHKNVLAGVSKYFESMFTSGFSERNQSEVKIEGCNYAFEALLKSAYTGKLNLSRGNVIEVLKLACYMQFNRVIATCSQFLSDELTVLKVTPEDAFLIGALAEPHGKPLENLRKLALRVLANGFNKFILTETFLMEVYADFLEKFLDRLDLAIRTTEEEVGILIRLEDYSIKVHSNLQCEVWCFYHHMFNMLLLPLQCNLQV